MTRGKQGGSSRSAGAAAWVALLRGVNVGGRHRLSMAALKGFFEAAGCGEVRTVGASGNVLFRAPAAVARAAPAKVAAHIDKECGHRPAMVLRSAAELAAVLRGNPFLAEGLGEEALYVSFLAERPVAAAAAALDPSRSPGDRFAVRGRELYLYLPGGVAASRLTSDYLDRTLRTMGTARNWRTVVKLGGEDRTGPGRGVATAGPPAAR